MGLVGVGRLPSNRRASTRSPLIVVRVGFLLVPLWCQVASHFVYLHPIVPCTPETFVCDRPSSSLYITCHISLTPICSIIKIKKSSPSFRLTWNQCGFRIDREHLHVGFQRRAHLSFHLSSPPQMPRVRQLVCIGIREGNRSV